MDDELHEDIDASYNPTIPVEIFDLDDETGAFPSDMSLSELPLPEHEDEETYSYP